MPSGRHIRVFVYLLACYLAARPVWMDHRADAVIAGAMEAVFPLTGPRTPVDEAMERVVQAAARGDCEAVTALMTPDREPAGRDAVMSSGVTRSDFAKASRRIRAAVAKELADGRSARAFAMIEAAHRMTRLFGRGVAQASPLHLHWMAETARQKLDSLVQRALQARQIPARDLPRLDALYRDLLARSPDADAAMQGQFALMDRLIPAFDRREGLLGLLNYHCWGDGLQQLRQIRREWAANVEDRAENFYSPHFIVKHLIPSFHEVRTFYRNGRLLRQDIRKLIATQSGVRA